MSPGSGQTVDFDESVQWDLVGGVEIAAKRRRRAKKSKCVCQREIKSAIPYHFWGYHTTLKRIKKTPNHSLHQAQRKQAHSHNRHARVPHKTAHRMRTKPSTALHNHMHRIMLTLAVPTLSSENHTNLRRPRLKRCAPPTNVITRQSNGSSPSCHHDGSMRLADHV